MPPPFDAETSVETLGVGQHLPERDGHRVWWCEGGEPGGLPVLIVHGGPGGRSRDEPLRWWAGLPVRWICMDQRGCGRSLPRGGVEANTLAHLLEDIELLRVHLGLSRWALAAGSWGAFVALSLAARHPDTVSGLLLRSPFLGSHEELAHHLSAWPAWLGAMAPGSAAGVPDPGQLYRLLRSTSQADTAFTRGDPWLTFGPWMQAYEAAQSSPGGVRARVPGPCIEPPAPGSGSDAADWRVHHHYATHGWTTGRDAWDDARRAAQHTKGPWHLVHGVDDAVCPVTTSESLAALRASAVLHRVEGGGHRMGQAPMRDALVQAARAWVQALASP